METTHNCSKAERVIIEMIMYILRLVSGCIDVKHSADPFDDHSPEVTLDNPGAHPLSPAFVHLIAMLLVELSPCSWSSSFITYWTSLRVWQLTASSGAFLVDLSSALGFPQLRQG